MHMCVYCVSVCDLRGPIPPPLTRACEYTHTHTIQHTHAHYIELMTTVVQARWGVFLDDKASQQAQGAVTWEEFAVAEGKVKCVRVYM